MNFTNVYNSLHYTFYKRAYLNERMWHQIKKKCVELDLVFVFFKEIKLSCMHIYMCYMGTFHHHYTKLTYGMLLLW